MNSRRNPIATAGVTIVLVLLLTLTIVGYLSGGLEAALAMLATFLILVIPLVLLVGLVLFVLKRL